MNYKPASISTSRLNKKKMNWQEFSVDRIRTTKALILKIKGINNKNVKSSVTCATKAFEPYHFQAIQIWLDDPFKYLQQQI